MTKKTRLNIPPIIQVLIWALIIFGTSKNTPSFGSGTQLRFIISVFIFTVGTIIALLGVLEFRKNQTTVDPRSPQKASSLVTSGIYQKTRNPMYVGFLLYLVSLCILLGSYVSIIWCVLFVVCMNIIQIIPEEKALLNIFGEDYIRYMKNTRRWI